MKRTPLKRGTSQLKRSGFKRKSAVIKIKKPKKKTNAKLKKELWKVFAQYVKGRDKGTCFTCGRRSSGQGLHAGHFIPKAAGGLALYFHEDNVKAQCASCNLFLEGNHYVFGQKLGEEKVAELYNLKQKVTKWTAQDFEDKIAEYKKKLEDLSKTQ